MGIIENAITGTCYYHCLDVNQSPSITKLKTFDEKKKPLTERQYDWQRTRGGALMDRNEISTLLIGATSRRRYKKTGPGKNNTIISSSGSRITVEAILQELCRRRWWRVGRTLVGDREKACWWVRVFWFALSTWRTINYKPTTWYLAPFESSYRNISISLQWDGEALLANLPWPRIRTTMSTTWNYEELNQPYQSNRTTVSYTHKGFHLDNTTGH